METDPTENIRRKMVAEINSEGHNRAELESRFGLVWSTDELEHTFEILGFMAPFVMVRNRASGKKGTLLFAHSPRFYYSFTEET